MPWNMMSFLSGEVTQPTYKISAVSVIGDAAVAETGPVS
jgi:hypothetical protein